MEEQDKQQNLRPKSLLALVADRIAKAGPTIKENVIEALSEKEIGVRQQHVLDALTLHENFERQIKGCQPDQPASYDAEMKEVSPATWSKKALENRKKLTEKLERLGGLLEKALAEGQFPELVKFLGENKQQQGGKPDPNPEPKQS